MGAPVRYPAGVSTTPKGLTFGDYPFPLTPNIAQYFNDFFQYVAADWTVTASTGTTALVAGNGGRILQTTAASAGDGQFNLKNPTHIQFTPGFPLWFCWMGQVGDNASDVRVGLLSTGAPFAATDGVWFDKANGSDNVNFTMRVASVSTTVAAVTTMPAATDIALGFYYDGAPNPQIQIFSSTPVPAPSAYGQQRFAGGYQVSAVGYNASNGVALSLPTGLLAAGFGHRTQSVAAKTLNTDYLVATPAVNRA